MDQAFEQGSFRTGSPSDERFLRNTLYGTLFWQKSNAKVKLEVGNKSRRKQGIGRKREKGRKGEKREKIKAEEKTRNTGRSEEKRRNGKMGKK